VPIGNGKTHTNYSALSNNELILLHFKGGNKLDVSLYAASNTYAIAAIVAICVGSLFVMLSLFIKIKMRIALPVYIFAAAIAITCAIAFFELRVSAVKELQDAVQIQYDVTLPDDDANAIVHRNKREGEMKAILSLPEVEYDVTVHGYWKLENDTLGFFLFIDGKLVPLAQIRGEE
jgi:hypothetical protein